MKKIIILSGKAKSGKTTTLLSVIEQLKKIATKITDKRPNRKNARDRTVIIEINGMIIIIITAGDTLEVIEKEFERVAPLACDILICATRTNGAGISHVKDIAKDHSIVHDTLSINNTTEVAEKTKEIIKMCGL